MNELSQGFPNRTKYKQCGEWRGGKRGKEGGEREKEMVSRGGERRGEGEGEREKARVSRGGEEREESG